MLFAPNGPLATVKPAWTRPLASAVTPCMAFKLQSPGPVAVPLLAHWVMTRDSPGEKPDACTRTRWPDWSPVAGVTVICWCPLVAVADAVAVAGAVVTAGGGVVVGLRVQGGRAAAAASGSEDHQHGGRCPTPGKTHDPHLPVRTEHSRSCPC